jgi:hypothetical protein
LKGRLLEAKAKTQWAEIPLDDITLPPISSGLSTSKYSEQKSFVRQNFIPDKHA